MCAFVASFRGELYDGYSAVVHPLPGEVLGAATLPSCDDGGGAFGSETFPVSRLPGVEPTIAIVSTNNPSQILVHQGVRDLPPEVKRYLEAPVCLEEDEPIELKGQWLGILGADGNTELDMVPPYDVEVLVQHASAPRYERADISVRVPSDLGKPLSREDVRGSLWEGGSIRISAACSGEGFRALSLDAIPVSPPTPDDLFGRTFVAGSVPLWGTPRELTRGRPVEVAFEKGEPAGVVRWEAGCNLVGGTFEITAHRLLVDEIVGTAVGCSGEQHYDDGWLAAFFRGDPKWQLAGDRLTLTSGETVIELEEKHA